VSRPNQRHRADAKHLQRENDRLRRELAERDRRIVDQAKQLTEATRQLAEADQQIADAEKQIADLERQLALRRQNSTTTSKPRSSDGLAGEQRMRGRRKKSRRKAGGQPGHPVSFAIIASEQKIVEVCAAASHSAANAFRVADGGGGSLRPGHT
jgi:chromosome segregation ATPase